MVRKSLQWNKIDNSTSRHIAYSKRKDGLVKMVNEISVSGDSEAGLVMFSPSGKLTCASGNKGRIEDIFLRYINEPDEVQGNPSMDAYHQVATGLPTTGSSINGNMLTYWSTASSMATPTCVPNGPPQPGIDHHLNNNNQRLWNNFPSFPSVGSSSSAANQMVNFNVD
ncbi:hypothetical protein LWI28_011115 [Acer negundo]|uniref:MADS-box domain-containing protein n=1 Tax=Acer negundo TaxID=4023 RepID=A0AAD5IU93_ACENE|nr:hypothetical protein LWI28_011115 [Acer negundo]